MPLRKYANLPESIGAAEAARAVGDILSTAQREPLATLDIVRTLEDVLYRQDPWTLLPFGAVRRLEGWIIDTWRGSDYPTQRALLKLIHPLDMPAARGLLETEHALAEDEEQERLELILETPREAAYVWLWMALKRCVDEVQRAAVGPQTHPFLPFAANALATMRDSFRYVPAPPPMWQTCWYPSYSEREQRSYDLVRLIHYDPALATSELGERILETSRHYLDIPSSY